jgi:hypothetical protein
MRWYRSALGDRRNAICKALDSGGGACKADAWALCDWPVGGGRTCDKPLCLEHAHLVGANRHYCPRHLAMIETDRRTAPLLKETA